MNGKGITRKQNECYRHGPNYYTSIKKNYAKYNKAMKNISGNY